MKKVSVIIPDTDSALAGKILTALRAQSIDQSLYEVLVIGSDRPGQVVEDDLVRLIPTPARAFASDKRNLGMQQAQGEIYAFIDDDCIPQPDWLEQHLNRRRQGEEIVGGAVTFGQQSYLQLADNVSAFHDLLPCTPPGQRMYLSTANLSVDRSVVERAGKMLEHKNRAEDLEWTVRFRSLGYRLYFEPKAVIYHDPNRRNFSNVWKHWSGDARDTLTIRLRYKHWLNTPSLAQKRWVYLWGAPFVAAWATRHSYNNAAMFAQYWHTLPLVYLTKLAWCWGAFKNFPFFAKRGFYDTV